jgi:class 3 adenylate cyclase
MNKQVILVVDDMPENAELLADILEPDYHIEKAADGYQALQIAMSAEPPDLILLDIMMPGLDGYEVCRLLKDRKSTKNIPIIFISARNDDRDETRGFEAGAVDYIRKPFSMPIVRSRIRTHLELKNQRRRVELHTLELEKTLNALDVRNQFIRRIFGRYVSDDIVDAILETPEGICIGGEEREVTIMMSDLRDFTSISEKLSAEDVVGILNIYLEIMTEIIIKYQGTINEFIGDAILVIFGAPVSQEDHARHAVACALEMQLGMAEVNRCCTESGYPELQQGIAVNTGAVVVGNIGSSKRSKYGIVGPNVNLTSRIESYCLGGQVLVSESTKSACGTVLRIDDHVEVRPKGISGPITVYIVGGIADDFDIYLPLIQRKPLQPLPQPVNVLYKILAEDQTQDQLIPGTLVALDELSAHLQTHRGFRRLTHLEIIFTDEKGEPAVAGLIARVAEAIPGKPFHSLLSFLRVPAPVREHLKNILPPSSHT